MHAGVTRVTFTAENADKVIADLKGPILDEHKKLRREGLRDAFFLVNREAGEAIGVAIWDDRGKLERTEGKTSRQDPDVKNPNRAPTDFAKKRAKAIQDEGASMESSDWYEVVAHT